MNNKYRKLDEDEVIKEGDFWVGKGWEFMVGSLYLTKFSEENKHTPIMTTNDYYRLIPQTRIETDDRRLETEL